MTEKEKLISRKEEDLKRFNKKKNKIIRTYKDKPQEFQEQNKSKIKELKTAYGDVKKDLKRLSCANVDQWEQYRKKVIDGLWDLNGRIDRLNLDLKHN